MWNIKSFKQKQNEKEVKELKAKTMGCNPFTWEAEIRRICLKPGWAGSY
jgi:hypothetical protein